MWQHDRTEFETSFSRQELPGINLRLCGNGKDCVSETCKEVNYCGILIKKESVSNNSSRLKVTSLAHSSLGTQIGFSRVIPNLQLLLGWQHNMVYSSLTMCSVLAGMSPSIYMALAGFDPRFTSQEYLCSQVYLPKRGIPQIESCYVVPRTQGLGGTVQSRGQCIRVHNQQYVT